MAQDMPSRSQALGFFAMVFGMFMAILDIQIVNSSINEIQAGVSASADQISWVQTAYLIAEVIMIPLSGMLTRILSSRVAFALSCAGFTLASVGCALSTSMAQLIAFRAAQGFLGGAMIPITYAVSFTLFPRRVMGSVQAVIGLTVTIAPALGPTIGGYVTEALSWHWLFLINVLPGILVCLGVWHLLDVDRADPDAVRRLDLIGLLLMAVFLGSLQYLLEEGPGEDWFASRTIVITAAVSTLAAALFFARMLRARHPIVDLHVFRNLNFAVGAALGFVLGIALYGLFFLMPLFLSAIRDYNSLQIGQVVAVTGVAMFLTAPVAGRASDHVDPRILLTVGLALVGVGSIMNADLTTEAGFWQFFWPQVVRGAGLVLCIIPITRIALGTLPFEEVANASGLFNVMRNLGGAFGLAMLGTFREVRLDYHWSEFIPAIQTTRPVVVERLQQLQGMLTGEVSDPYAGAVALLAREITLKSQTLAFNDIFFGLGVIYLIAVPCMLLLRKPNVGAA